MTSTTAQRLRALDLLKARGTAGDTLSFLRKHEPTTREVQLERGYIVTDADTKLGCPPARCLRSYEDEHGLVDAVYEFTDGSRLRFKRGEGYGYMPKGN